VAFLPFFQGLQRAIRQYIDFTSGQYREIAVFLLQGADFIDLAQQTRLLQTIANAG